MMFAFIPRIYAHSFFNSKDVGFLSMFLITLCVAQYAFAKNKTWLYVVLGICVGYTTSIRIMGVMLGGFIGIFMLIDFLKNRKLADKNIEKRPWLNMVLYAVGFCFSVYIAWPYLWPSPVHNFLEAYRLMSHYDWDASTLLNGNYVKTTELPWTYFPSWFVITSCRFFGLRQVWQAYGSLFGIFSRIYLILLTIRPNAASCCTCCVSSYLYWP